MLFSWAEMVQSMLNPRCVWLNLHFSNPKSATIGRDESMGMAPWPSLPGNGLADWSQRFFVHQFSIGYTTA